MGVRVGFASEGLAAGSVAAAPGATSPRAPAARGSSRWEEPSTNKASHARGGGYRGCAPSPPRCVGRVACPTPDPRCGGHGLWLCPPGCRRVTPTLVRWGETVRQPHGSNGSKSPFDHSGSHKAAQGLWLRSAQGAWCQGCGRRRARGARHLIRCSLVAAIGAIVRVDALREPQYRTQKNLRCASIPPKSCFNLGVWKTQKSISRHQCYFPVPHEATNQFFSLWNHTTGNYFLADTRLT